MDEGNKLKVLELKAEIVEIYERDGKRFVKLLHNPGIIDIETDKIKELHLGDKVILKSVIKTDDIIEIH